MPDLLDEEILMVGNAISTARNHRCWAFWYDPSGQLPTIYWVECLIKQGTPHTPVTLLLQSLMERYKEDKDAVRRGRVYISSRITPTCMCRGMAEFIGVAIRSVPDMQPQVQGVVYGVNPYGAQPRARYGMINTFIKFESVPITSRQGLQSFKPLPLGDDPNFGTLENESKESGFHTVHRIYMMIAFALVGARTWEDNVPGYNIGAVIVAPSGKLLAWGVNTRHQNYTFHAEVNALQSYYLLSGGKALPRGTRIYTTLKPCRMCAGMIRMGCEVDGDIKVFYGQEDDGAHACNTALDQLGNKQQQLGQGHAKPLSIYGTGIYYHSVMRAGRTTSNLGYTLEEERKRSGLFRARFLRSDTALSLFNKTLQSVARKQHKYDVRRGNDNVRRVLNHLQPFIEQYHLNEYEESRSDIFLWARIEQGLLLEDEYDDPIPNDDDMQF